MKRNAIVRIILFSLTIVILLGILITGLSANFLSYITISDDETATLGSAGSVNAAEVSNISIEWAAGNIRIEPGDVTEITFAETVADEGSQQMAWKHTGNTLKLQFSKGNISFPSFGFSSNISKDLVITVPRNWQCKELSIDVASADVEILDMTVQEVDFDGASGICQFENCIVDELSVDTASGNIHFTGTLNVLDCDAASADCSIQLSNIPNRIDLDSASGDLDLTLPENAGFTVSMDALSSQFTSDFPTTMSGGSYVCGDGRCRIEVDAMSGNVTIRKATTNTDGTF